jgi:hypothetical protein
MYIGRNYCQILIKPEFSRQISKSSNIKFHENPSSGSRMTKKIVAFRDVANAPKML